MCTPNDRRFEQLRRQNQILVHRLTNARTLIAVLTQNAVSAPCRFPGERRWRMHQLSALLRRRGDVPFKMACAALGLSRATAYRLAQTSELSAGRLGAGNLSR